MPLDSIINITISLTAPPATRASFGIPLIIGDFSPAQDALFGADLTAEMTSLTWPTVLASLGFSSSDDLWNSVRVIFGQELVVERVIIGRRADPVAQVNTYLVTGASDGTYTITINGVDFSFVASSSTVTAIRDALVSAINGGTEPVTAAPVSTDSLTVTADVAGVPFTSITASSGDAITDTPTTPNVGIGEDLTAINTERSDWYWVLEVDRVDVTNKVLALAAESFVRDIQVDILTNDADAQGQSSTTDDIGGQLSDLNILRTGVWWNDDLLEFVDSAAAGFALPQTPGSLTWANMPLRLVTGISPNDALTSESRLDDKHYNWLENYQAAGSSTTRNGWRSGGTFTDVVRLRDNVKNEMQLRLFEMLRDLAKVAYTDEDMPIIESVIEGTLGDFAESGGVVASSIVVNVPQVSDQTVADKGNRLVNDITWAATLQGAAQKLNVAGNLSP